MSDTRKFSNQDYDLREFRSSKREASAVGRGFRMLGYNARVIKRGHVDKAGTYQPGWSVYVSQKVRPAKRGVLRLKKKRFDRSGPSGNLYLRQRDRLRPQMRLRITTYNRTEEWVHPKGSRLHLDARNPSISMSRYGETVDVEGMTEAMVEQVRHRLDSEDGTASEILLRMGFQPPSAGRRGSWTSQRKVVDDLWARATDLEIAARTQQLDRWRKIVDNAAIEIQNEKRVRRPGGGV